MARPDPGTDRSRARAGGNGLMALPAKLPHHPVVLGGTGAAGRGHPAADRRLDHRARRVK
jgi:hypothetical protein